MRQSTDSKIIQGSAAFEENQLCDFIPKLTFATMEQYTTVILSCSPGPLRGRYMLLQSIDKNYLVFEEVDVLIKKVFAPGERTKQIRL